ncbi:MAG: hypothetical protein WC441_01325 [Patescibacteria group bacterium]
MELEHRQFLEQFVSDYIDCSNLGDINRAFNRAGKKEFESLMARAESILQKITDLEALLVSIDELDSLQAPLIKRCGYFQALVAKRGAEIASSINSFDALWVIPFQGKFHISGPPAWLLTALDSRAAVLLKEEALAHVFNLDILANYLFDSDLYPESRRAVLNRIREVLPSEKDVLVVARQCDRRPNSQDKCMEEFKYFLFKRLEEMLDDLLKWDNPGVMIKVIEKIGSPLDPDLERLLKVKAMEFLEK